MPANPESATQEAQFTVRREGAGYPARIDCGLSFVMYANIEDKDMPAMAEILNNAAQTEGAERVVRRLLNPAHV